MKKIIKNSPDKYYQDASGIIQDGNEWNSELENGEISIDVFNALDEVYWSSNSQAWLLL
jgi:hypothetical protein